MGEALLLPFLQPRGHEPTALIKREDAVRIGGGAPSDPDGLRSYQRDDLNSILAELDDPFIRATCLVQATGLGKTRVGSALAKHWIESGRGRVLWAVTGEELCDQAVRTMRAVVGEYSVSLERAGWKACGTPVVVGSVPTMKGDRLKEWDPETFSLIIFDESHHAPADGPRAIFDHFINASIVGLTATPERLDKKAMGNVFDSFVPCMLCKGHCTGPSSEGHRQGRQMPWGWKHGYLVTPIGVEVTIESVDLSKLKTTAGDFTAAGLDKEMLKSAAVIGHETFTRCGTRRTLVFTPGVWTAHAVCNDLNGRRPGCARVVDGDTDPDVRVRIFAEFARGDFQYLINCRIVGEGVDLPFIEAVVDAAPTKSRSRYIQRIGRGGRPLPGIAELPTDEERLAAIAASSKPNFLILQLTGNAGKHSVVSFVTLDGSYSAVEQKKAKEIMEDQPELPLPDALKQARAVAAQLAARKQQLEEAHRRLQEEAAKAAEIRSRGRKFDPFVEYGIKDPDAASLDLSWKAPPLPPKDAFWMKSRDIPTEGMTVAQVRKLQRTERAYLARGLADFRTLAMLRRKGINVKTISMDKAREMLRKEPLRFSPPKQPVPSWGSP